MKENWKKIPNHSDYEVSDMGRVRSWKTPRSKKMSDEPKILKNKINKKVGYYNVTIYTTREHLEHTTFID